MYFRTLHFPGFHYASDHILKQLEVCYSKITIISEGKKKSFEIRDKLVPYPVQINGSIGWGKGVNYN